MDIVKIDTGGLCGAVLGPEHPAGGSWRDSALVRNKVWPWVGAQGLLLCWKQEERAPVLNGRLKVFELCV